MTSDMRLDGQVTVISGAGRGIGRAIALDLASRGAAIVVNDYGTDLTGAHGGDKGPAHAVAQEIIEAGGRAIPVVADVGTEAGAVNTVAAAVDEFGKIDSLIHAACVFPKQCPFEDMPRADYARVVRVTVDGAWGLAQAAWPHFKRQSNGRIVFIQSAAGFYGRIGMPAYSIAKSSLIGFTHLLKQEGQPHGILVNNLSPVGWSRAPASEEGLEYLSTMMPAEDLGPIAALLVHPDFHHSGLLLHSGGGVVSRMFVPETRGVAFSRDQFTPSGIMARLDEILDETNYRTPSRTDDVGKSLFQMVLERDEAAAAN